MVLKVIASTTILKFLWNMKSKNNCGLRASTIHSGLLKMLYLHNWKKLSWFTKKNSIQTEGTAVKRSVSYVLLELSLYISISQRNSNECSITHCTIGNQHPNSEWSQGPIWDSQNRMQQPCVALNKVKLWAETSQKWKVEAYYVYPYLWAPIHCRIDFLWTYWATCQIECPEYQIMHGNKWIKKMQYPQQHVQRKRHVYVFKCLKLTILHEQ